MKFKKGDPRCNREGGARPGAGRPPNWFKERCKALVDRKETLDFLQSVLDGGAVQPRFVDGEMVLGTADVNDRIKVFVELAQFAGYKKSTELDLGENAVNFFQLIKKAEEERGLGKRK